MGEVLTEVFGGTTYCYIVTSNGVVAWSSVRPEWRVAAVSILEAAVVLETQTAQKVVRDARIDWLRQWS